MAYYMYQDAAGYWRWRLKAANGKIVADSGEGYVTKDSCRAGIAIVKASSAAPVYET